MYIYICISVYVYIYTLYMIIVKWGEKLQVAEFGGMNIHNNYHLLIRIRFSPTWILIISYTIIHTVIPSCYPHYPHFEWLVV